MKTSTIVVVVALVVAVGAWYWMQNAARQQSADYTVTYIIEGQPVTFVNGRAEETPAAPDSTSSPQADSASKVVTQYFGNPAAGDVDGDGVPDVAFLLTQSNGGSGTFYYIVATLVTVSGGYQGTNAVLLGDRIAPQTTEIQDGTIIVNYADRKTGEPMTAQPSVGVSKYLKVEGTTLTEINP